MEGDWGFSHRNARGAAGLPHGLLLANGSQAFGALGGYGMLYDGAGHDAYVTGSGEPMPDRGDGVTRRPSISPAGVMNTALFMDRGT